MLITPSSREELALLTALLKMSIKARVLSEEEKEYLGLTVMMREAENSPRVSRKRVLRKLNWA